MQNILCIICFLIFSSCAQSPRRNKAQQTQLAQLGAESVIIIMNEKDFRPLGKCGQLGRIKIVSPNLQQHGLNVALEELKQRAFIKGADHAVIVDYTNDLLFADLYFCSNDYSDFK